MDAKFSTSSKHETRKESIQGKMGGMKVTGVGEGQQSPFRTQVREAHRGQTGVSRLETAGGVRDTCGVSVNVDSSNNGSASQPQAHRTRPAS